MRVANLIRQEVSLVLAGRLSDPRLAGVTVTEVEMSADLKRAFIYFVCPRGEQDRAHAGFDKAAGFIKKAISPRLDLKFVPELIFRHDASTDSGEDMDRLLAELGTEQSAEKQSE